jgi:flagellar M-ring protein FliF
MNNSFQQLLAQLQAIWKQLGVNQRVSVVFASVLLVAGTAGLVIWSSRADYALLYGRLDGSEASKVLAALDESKVPYKVTAGAIMVPADKVYTTRMQLAGKGLPRAGDGVGFEIFDKPNFGISDFVQRANYLRAVQGELSRTISQVDSIESARVMVVMPENRLLVDGQKKPTASVFVKVRGNATLPPQTVAAIRFLVANSVEGLNANFVSVVDNQGNVLSENNTDDSISGLSSTQLTARKNLELYLSKKAEGLLEKALGPGQAMVRVSADINYDTVTKTEEKFDPDGQVVKQSTITDDQIDTQQAQQTGGVPGVQTNAASGETNVVATAAPTTVNKTRKKQTENKYEINKSTSTLAQGAGGVTRVTAAVFVAQQMTGTGTNRVAVPRKPEELEKLKRIVQSALGAREGADSQDVVTLEEMPFNDTQIVEMVKQLETQEKRQMWIETAKTLMYPALALGALAFFWRAFKRTPNENIPIGIPLGDGAMDGVRNGNGSQRNGKTPGVVTVDVLNQLIRENPDNMTQAIRGWMTTGNNNGKNNKN